MKEIEFPFGKTKAREMFEAQQAIQQSHAAAVKGTKTHRVKK